MTREDGSTTIVDPAHVDSLLPPRPGFVLSQRRESDSSLASGLSSNTPAEVGDVVGESVLDYVVFDGEDEAPDSEERNMSRRVEKEGKMRRAKSRKEKSGRKGFLGLGHKKEASSSTINGHSYPPNLAYTFGDATPDTQTPIKESDPRSYFLNDRDHSRPASPASPAGSDTEFDYPQHGAKRESHHSDHSINNLMSASRNFADSNDGVALDVYERDQQDLDIIAELARTGRPDIGKTIDEELRICQSKLLVACESDLVLLSALLIQQYRLWTSCAQRQSERACVATHVPGQELDSADDFLVRRLRRLDGEVDNFRYVNRWTISRSV